MYKSWTSAFFFWRQLPRLLGLLRCDFFCSFTAAQGRLGENNFSISLLWLTKRKRRVWQCVCFHAACQDFHGVSQQFLPDLVLRNTLTMFLYPASSSPLFSPPFFFLPPLPPSFFLSFNHTNARIVQPMIDQSNRAGKSPIVTVFKSRRRKPSTLHAPGGPSDGKYRNVLNLLGVSPPVS